MAYVNKNGRSVGPGRVTRASHLVRTRSRRQEQPLPIELQCHPKALSPTSRNPQCYTYRTYVGRGVHMANTMTRTQLLQHPDIRRRKARYALEGEHGTLYCDDLNFAMAWQTAMGILGTNVEVIET